jgi:hypothetical protein
LERKDKYDEKTNNKINKIDKKGTKKRKQKNGRTTEKIIDIDYSGLN